MSTVGISFENILDKSSKVFKEKKKEKLFNVEQLLLKQEQHIIVLNLIESYMNIKRTSW